MTPNPQSVCAKRNTWQAVCGLPEDHYIHHLELTKNAYAHKFEPSEPASLNAPAGTEEQEPSPVLGTASSGYLRYCDEVLKQPCGTVPIATPQPVAGEGTQVVTFKRNSNNGAGLHAVFVGDMPVHHFDHDKPAKVELYMNRLRAEIAKVADARFKEGYKEGLKDAAYYTLAEVTPKEIAVKIQQELIGNIDGTWTKWFEDKCAAILRPFITPASTPEVSVCPRCEGSGIYTRLPGHDTPCAICDGSGIVRPPEKLQCPRCFASILGTTQSIVQHSCEPHPLQSWQYKAAFAIAKMKDSISTKHYDVLKIMNVFAEFEFQAKNVPTPATPTESVREGQPNVKFLREHQLVDGREPTRWWGSYTRGNETGFTGNALAWYDTAVFWRNRAEGVKMEGDDWEPASPSVPLLDVEGHVPEETVPLSDAMRKKMGLKPKETP